MFDKYELEKTSGKNPDPLIKESIMHIFETISVPVKANRKAEEIEQVLRKYIFPEIDDSQSKPHSLLQERAVFVIKSYCSIEFKDYSLLKAITESLCKMLVHNDLSVRVITSITLPSLMKKKEVIQLLEVYVKNLLQEYLKLMNQIDLEELLVGLKNIIDHFGDKVLDFAVDLTKELSIQFDRLIHINIEDDNGESQLAAEGVIRAIGKIVNICSSKEELILQIEKIIQPIINYTLSGEGFEYLDEGLEIVKILVQNPSTVSNITWSYFTPINFSIIGDETENNLVLKDYPETALEGIGYDSLQDELYVLSLFFKKDIKSLISCKDQYGFLYVDRLFQTVNQIIKNCKGDIDVSNSVVCCLIFSHLLDKCSTMNLQNPNQSKMFNIDSYAEIIVEFVIDTLLRVKQLTYKIGLFGVLSSAILYDPVLICNQAIKKAALDKVTTIWLTFVDSLKGKKDIRRNIVGLSTLLIAIPSTQSSINSNLVSNYTIILRKTYLLMAKFDKLNDKVPEDHLDEEEEEDDFERNLKLAKQNMDNEEFDDDDFGDDLDDIDYMLGGEWSSDFDSINPVLFVRDKLTLLKSQNEQFYSNAISVLNEVEKKNLQDLIVKHEKNSKK
eukprot:CAMPEP_0170535788 /NCGR_PEP_ID=MMETSP0209-20121228/101788_1 /TAXON_ID=665100 ORGANISM="Litonotus pictus, Strain P1" /NCGR_SAMPLE_ID=MMETSP0209 /ASSEMBLY_ACC=CAM_ASM_000301 /LENGTH=613 /DNA_ID=CAMNT_0010837087 /DNA_START=1431 /DNA_END=3272 /DNA_ORIENTATION=+